MSRILIGLVLALIVGWAAAGDVLQVPAVYSTIAGALSASAAGDTVEIAPGVYREEPGRFTSHRTARRSGAT
jgi:2-keto-3-deoxy-galactonokinase